MLKSFDDNVRAILKNHDIQDEKLESALIELFNQYERRIFSRDFFNKIERELENRQIQRERARGISR